MRALRRASDFFELRPFFTLWSVRALWWIFLAAKLYAFSRGFGPAPPSNFYLWFKIYRWIDIVMSPWRQGWRW
jgi:hypothetical protein